MAQPYLDDLTALLASLPENPMSGPTITCKHFFSGAAAYADEEIFVSLSPAGLALKLPQEDCDALIAQGGRPLQYSPKAPVKKGYVVLTEDIAEDHGVLAGWVSRSLAFVMR